MENKAIGLTLLFAYAMGAFYEFLKVTTFLGWELMTVLDWFKTLVMIALFVGGVYYLRKK